MINEFKMPSYVRQIIILVIILAAAIAMNYTAPILSPVILTIFLSLIIYPFLMWLNKKGLSYNLSVIVTLLGVLGVGVGVIWFLVVALAQLVKELPTVLGGSSGFIAENSKQIVEFIVAHIPETDSAGLISSGIIILFGTVFLVYELPQIKIKLEKGIGAHNPSLLDSIFSLVGDFVEYFIIRAKVNIFYGVGVSAILLLFDINFAVLWGLLTFVLGFIPYIGIIIAAIPPVLVAWAKYGIYGAIVMGIFFVIINTIAESYIFPKLTGKGLQLSVFVVFISVFIWGWILGPTGFFVGVPLTLIIIKFLQNYDETRWMASLMIDEEVEGKEKETESK
jgi:AI-2 transport protein TqsA